MNIITYDIWSICFTRPLRTHSSVLAITGIIMYTVIMYMASALLCFTVVIYQKITLNMRGPSCLVHPCVRDKRRMSEIDLSQSRHGTAFWWRHNGPVTSQLTDQIKWPSYRLELIGIYVHINTHKKESLTQRCHRSTNVQMCWNLFAYIYMVWV